VDDVFEMAKDMNPAYIEDEFLIPEYTALLKTLQTIDTSEKPDAVLSKFFSEIHSQFEEEDNGLSFGISTDMQGFNLWRLAVRELGQSRFMDGQIARGLHESHPGGLKLHHSNRKRLLEIGAPKLANSIVATLSAYLKHLEERRLQRRDPVLSVFED